MSDQDHAVVIIGGGSGGITTAARLRKAGVTDIALIEPADTHYYQPLWTLVGGGRAKIVDSGRPMASVIPKGVTWVRDSVVSVDPEASTVTTERGTVIRYGRLVVSTGIQLNWNGIPGMEEALGSGGVSSNYSYELAPKTWDNVRRTTSGTAIFHMPPGPIKCAGAPQKIAYLACDYWREQGVLENIRPILVLPTPGMFGVKVWSDVLVDVAKRYGIEVRFNSAITQMNPVEQTVVIKNNETGAEETVHYDFAHMTPPQSAPDWLRNSALADPENPFGYMGVNKNTMQHNVYPNVFGLGDCTTTPNSKTGAAIRKQAPVLVENLVASMKGSNGKGSYDGYASCPITTSRSSLLLCEFDYDLNVKPSIPLINTKKEIKDFNKLKQVGLPVLYWNLMLKGKA
ncbi:MAG: NAD(P)/FAD-dependent oxidoreductase [Candidatus Nanopelagicales bacterium]|jgi:sulfide:quinone oxidoreductase|nr:NAD(P)/FAD-dependent oxidoreductase [Candidatus Nanopelagicales bacterium]